MAGHSLRTPYEIGQEEAISQIIAMENADLQRRYNEMRIKAEERRIQKQDRDLERKEHVSNALDMIDKKLGNPARMNWQQDLEKVVTDPLYHRAVAEGRESRVLIDNYMKSLNERHNDYRNWWSEYAQKHGYNGDVRKLPLNQAGEIDSTEAQKILDSSLSQKRESDIRHQEAIMHVARVYGLVPQSIDPETGFVNRFGRPKEDSLLAGLKKTDEKPQAEPTARPALEDLIRTRETGAEPEQGLMDSAQMPSGASEGEETE